MVPIKLYRCEHCTTICINFIPFSPRAHKNLHFFRKVITSIRLYVRTALKYVQQAGIFKANCRCFHNSLFRIGQQHDSPNDPAKASSVQIKRETSIAITALKARTSTKRYPLQFDCRTSSE